MNYKELARELEAVKINVDVNAINQRATEVETELLSIKEYSSKYSVASHSKRFAMEFSRATYELYNLLVQKLSEILPSDEDNGKLLDKGEFYITSDAARNELIKITVQKTNGVAVGKGVAVESYSDAQKYCTLKKEKNSFMIQLRISQELKNSLKLWQNCLLILVNESATKSAAGLTHCNQIVTILSYYYHNSIVYYNHKRKILYKTRKGIKMDMKERITALRAMEFLVRSVNNEELLIPWLMEGVADGDIDENTTDEELIDYVDNDKFFADIMATFLCVMHSAAKDGGLYIDGVVSE